MQKEGARFDFPFTKYRPFKNYLPHHHCLFQLLFSSYLFLSPPPNLLDLTSYFDIYIVVLKTRVECEYRSTK